MIYKISTFIRRSKKVKKILVKKNIEKMASFFMFLLGVLVTLNCILGIFAPYSFQ